MRRQSHSQLWYDDFTWYCLLWVLLVCKQEDECCFAEEKDGSEVRVALPHFTIIIITASMLITKQGTCLGTTLQPALSQPSNGQSSRISVLGDGKCLPAPSKNVKVTKNYFV